MNKKPKICVFSGSSADVNISFLKQAWRLGALCADTGIIPVSGGGCTGLMKNLIDGCFENGGETIGVLPQFMIDNNWHHTGVTRLIVTDNMHQRKSTMSADTIAAVAMPGGIGTFEELFEIITWRQLGLYDGEIIIMNIDGYYDFIIEMLGKAIDEGFMKKEHAELWKVVDSADSAIEIIKSLLS